MSKTTLPRNPKVHTWVKVKILSSVSGKKCSCVWKAQVTVNDVYCKYFVLRVDRSHLAEYRSRYLINAIADEINKIKMEKKSKNQNLRFFFPTRFQKKRLLKKKILDSVSQEKVSPFHSVALTKMLTFKLLNFFFLFYWMFLEILQNFIPKKSFSWNYFPFHLFPFSTVKNVFSWKKISKYKINSPWHVF